MPRTLRVVLADDFEMVRVATKALLEQDTEVNVVGLAHDGVETWDMTQTLRPEVLVLDLALPRRPGLEVLVDVVRHCPETAVVVYTGFGSAGCAATAIRSGARGFVPKWGRIAELRHAVRVVGRGGRYVAAGVSHRDEGWNPRGVRISHQPAYAELSPREAEVLRLVAFGNGTSQIATRLGIGERTVETFRSNILRKLDLKNAQEMIRWAFERGLCFGTQTEQSI